jgi:hypothetical protein
LNSFDLDGYCEKKKAGLNLWRRARNAKCTVSNAVNSVKNAVTGLIDDAKVTASFGLHVAGWALVSAQEAISRAVVPMVRGACQNSVVGSGLDALSEHGTAIGSGAGYALKGPIGSVVGAAFGQAAEGAAKIAIITCGFMK